MAETLQVLKSRRSCRSFTSQMVEPEKLQKIMEAGQYAASGMGKQSAIILSVTNRELRDKIAAMNAEIKGSGPADPFYHAPQMLIVLANKAVPTYVYDGTLVMANMMTAAEDLGVATCWIHRAKQEFESEFGKSILADLGIEGDYEGIAHLAIGYAAAAAPERAPRKANYTYSID